MLTISWPAIKITEKAGIIRENSVEVTTRDVHFVMSAVLPFVNYINHTVKTCIGRNCQSYLFPMNKIVSTSSVTCLFDTI